MRVAIYSGSEDFTNKLAERLRRMGFQPVTAYEYQSNENLPYGLGGQNDVALALCWGEDLIDSLVRLNNLNCPTVLIVPKLAAGYWSWILGSVSEGCTDAELKDAIKAARRLSDRPKPAHAS
jgi:hypothetical protein